MTKEKPTVSAIIPAYNRADLVAPAIQSAIDQTYQDIEIIVVDDGSTDNTEEVVNEFIKRDSRVRYIKHEKNKGGSAARNTGIKNARGEYLAFLDSDCQWLPEKIEKQLQVFSEGDARLGAVGSGTLNLSGNKIRRSIRTGDFGDIYHKLLDHVGVRNTDSWPGGTPTIMIKRECFEKVGEFDELLESCQDHDIYIRIAKYYYFDVVPEPLVIIKSDMPDGISSNAIFKLNGRRRMLEKYADEWPKISKVKSHYSSLVGTILCREGKMWKGRKYLLMAVVSFPFSLRNWIYFAASFFPSIVYKRLAIIKSNLRYQRDKNGSF